MQLRRKRANCRPNRSRGLSPERTSGSRSSALVRSSRSISSQASMRGVTLPGALIEVAVVDAASLVKAPDHLSFPAIASLPIAATTAWKAVEARNLSPGATVLLVGTGGVSIFALQFARAGDRDFLGLQAVPGAVSRRRRDCQLSHEARLGSGGSRPHRRRRG
jgi:NADPH:quinone reductase-like Zn-dependent oxidoreductase